MPPVVPQQLSPEQIKTIIDRFVVRINDHLNNPVINPVESVLYYFVNNRLISNNVALQINEQDVFILDELGKELREKYLNGRNLLTTRSSEESNNYLVYSRQFASYLNQSSDLELLNGELDKQIQTWSLKFENTIPEVKTELEKAKEEAQSPEANQDNTQPQFGPDISFKALLDKQIGIINAVVKGSVYSPVRIIGYAVYVDKLLANSRSLKIPRDYSIYLRDANEKLAKEYSGALGKLRKNNKEKSKEFLAIIYSDVSTLKMPIDLQFVFAKLQSDLQLWNGLFQQGEEYERSAEQNTAEQLQNQQDQLAQEKDDVVQKHMDEIAKKAQEEKDAKKKKFGGDLYKQTLAVVKRRRAERSLGIQTHRPIINRAGNLLDPEVLADLYENDNIRFEGLLTQEQRRILTRLRKENGRPLSARQEYIIDKLSKITGAIRKRTYDPIQAKISGGIDSKLTRWENNLAEGGLLRKFVGHLKDRGKKKQNLITAPLYFVADRIRQGVKTVIETTKLAIKSTAAFQTVSGIHTAIGNQWNRVTTSQPVQAIIKVGETIKSGMEVASDLVSGARTGLLYAVPGLLIGSALGPAAAGVGAVIGFVGGTAAGFIGNRMTRVFNTNLATFSGELTEAQLKLSLNNLENWEKLLEKGTDLSWISNPANRELIRKMLPEMEMLEFNSIRGMRKLHNVFRSVNIAGIGGLIGAGLGLWLGVNPLLLGIAGATTAGLGGYFLRETIDKVAYEFAKAAPGLHALLKFPAFSLLDITSGSSTLSEQINILRDEGLSGLWANQKESIGLFKGSKGVMNAFNTLQYISGTGTLTGWAANVMLKVGVVANALPPIIKFAPLIVPAVYALGGILGLWSVTTGGMIAATAIGIGATITAVIFGTITGTNIFGGAAAYGAVTAAAYGSGFANWLATKIDNTLDRFGGAANGLNGLFSLMGVYNLVNSLRDLVEGSINSLGDYARALVIIASLTALPILLEHMKYDADRAVEIEDSTPIESTAEPTETPTPEVSPSSMYLPEDNEKIIAGNFTLPPMTYDCKNISGNAIVSDVNFEINDIVETRNLASQQYLVSLQGENNGQEIFVRNLKSVYPQVLSDGYVKSKMKIGDC